MRNIIHNKCSLCRRSGKKLYLKGERCFLEKCAMTKRNYPPGPHGENARRRKSEYGRQLIEKQKLRDTYGLGENQFVKYINLARRGEGVATSNLWQILESRLDNVIFRLGWASSRAHARQTVSHGLVLVNGRKVDIPSYRIKKDDVIALKETYVKKLDNLAQVTKKNLRDRRIPSWIKVEKDGKSAKIAKMPELLEESRDIDMTLVLEYYTAR
jgi:small subunit ribosomal protein S4